MSIEMNEKEYNDLISRLNYLEAKVAELEHNRYCMPKQEWYEPYKTISTQACDVPESHYWEEEIRNKFK